MPLLSSELDPTSLLKGCHILLVEDCDDLRLLVGRKLRAYGALLEEAIHGKEVLEKVQKGEFDIILMDIQMPGIDGYEVTQKLREQGYNKPIIALTANALYQEKQKAQEAGFNDTLAKPIDLQTMLQSLMKLKKTP